jgi:aryl sulfotransferase
MYRFARGFGVNRNELSSEPLSAQAHPAPLGGAFWDGGAETFIHKGTNGRGRHVLTPAESAEHERLARGKPGPDCAAWLAGGALGQGLADAA